uniref:putative inactive carboxylesterase 4 n=1 Tax=Styela clava TaxID=7725 RepID=UPI001939400E|nr:putative inactive carboxylesterase 4 [Styela clava]
MSQDCPTLKIKDGKLKGFMSQADDPSAVPVYNYLNIPFGKPPTGKRRFLAPEKSEPWDGILDATKPTHHPPQDNEIGHMYADYLPMKDTLGAPTERQSEDCLRLNVFTPSVEKSSKLAVMVWIVGGGYMRGMAGIYDGVALSGMNNVVTVSPNYRANALGFLSLGKNSKVPGNNALRDIILALEWVRDNIESFGGNPSNVTIFGESAGGVMTELLMMSPLSRDLIHKAISMSGSPLAPTVFGGGEATREVLLKALNINASEPDAILEKLQEVPVDVLIEVQKKFYGPYAFQPIVDGHVITDTPENISSTGQRHKIPFLTGVCDSECAGILAFVLPPRYMEGSSKEEVKAVFEEAFKLRHPNTACDKVVDRLMAAYSDVAADNDKYKYSRVYAEMAGDSIFVVPAIVSATAHSAMQCPTYFYYITKPIEFNHSESNGPGIKNKLDFVKCDHAAWR